MRIFSIHKSKSKKQVSEKTPKLAAKKFLEKRKVGTVIYLHEHPSGKIHGPYRKEYDKKIMKGGLSIIDFRVDRNTRLLKYPPILTSPFEPQMSDLNSGIPKQLIIKQTNVGFFGEPRFFFGNNTMTDNDQPKNYYYTYNCKNKDKFDRKIDNLILFRKLTPIPNSSPTIEVLNDLDVKDIPEPILLGFYTQYIDHVKSKILNEDQFTNQQTIPVELIYMRRLFYYLLLNIFPIITKYIITRYLTNMGIGNIQKLINDNPELIYFFNIFNFINKINLAELVESIVSICKLSSADKQILTDNLIREVSISQLDFRKLSEQKQINNIIKNTQEIKYTPDPINQVEQILGSSPMSEPTPAPAQEGISTPLTTANISQGLAMSGTGTNGGILEICFYILLAPFIFIAKVFAFFAG
jgi:hypothetical protein